MSINKAVWNTAALSILLIGGGMAVAVSVNTVFPSVSRYPVGVVLVIIGVWNVGFANVIARRNASVWTSVPIALTRRLVTIFGAIIGVGGIARLLH